MGIGARLLRMVRRLLTSEAAPDAIGRESKPEPENPATEGVTGSPMTYPWYETVQGDSLAQGDLLLGFDVFVPEMSGDVGADLVGELRTLDVVVMTQTCDIVQGKVGSLLLCPFWDLWGFVEAAEAKKENWGRQQRDALRKGNLPGYHLLNEASQDGIQIGLGVVDFHEVYTAPTNQITEFTRIAGNRLRLCSPYKEHLAQAFARFFMRVGLPVDIPPEKLKSRQDK